jgi:uncharacterized membrane protein YdcZ (DUF606 family)
MNGALLSLILAVIGGALLANQAPINAILGKASGVANHCRLHSPS